MKKNKIFLIGLLVITVIISSGCESFRKKFIRKPKYASKEEEMVIVPKNYSKLQLPVDKAYKQYYTYWKAWHNELMTALSEQANEKKVISCLEQIVLNLDRMKDLLNNENKIKLIDGYMAEVSGLKEEVRSSGLLVYGYRARMQSERLLRNIQRDLTFSKIKGDLKW